MTARQRDRLMVVVSPLAVLIIWEICSRTDLVDRRILAPPTVIVATIVQLIQTGGLLNQAGTTLARFFAGFFVGLIPGTLIGLAGLVTAGIIGSTLFTIAGAIEKRVIPWVPSSADVCRFIGVNAFMEQQM